VNKLNTKAEVRFHVSSADWLDAEVRERLLEYQNNKVNKDGELVITSQEHRCDDTCEVYYSIQHIGGSMRAAPVL